MICLYLQAPFGAFRPLMAGNYRPTAAFLTPSAAYGLLLNVAGVEMRQPSDKHPMTLIREGLPRFRVALGIPAESSHRYLWEEPESASAASGLPVPATHTLYQQLHNYPVGNSGQERAVMTKGCKYNIQPIRRAFLSPLRACIAVQGASDFEEQLRGGLRGEARREYGLLFLGDNNFLVDRLEEIPEFPQAHWFIRLLQDAGGMPNHVTRLTTRIDRADMSRTESALYAPVGSSSCEIPSEAWTEVGY